MFISKCFDKNDPNRELDLQEAKEYYYQMIKEGNPYVCLLYSDDWTSSGYWVEGIKHLIFNGYMILEYNISEERDKKINTIIE